MDVGFNFRGTAGYVTDPAGTYAVLGEGYPNTYAGGVVGGWTSAGLNFANRNAALDARLAGINFLAASGTMTFRFDLPAAGSYRIGLALGDESSSQPTNSVVIKDNATTILTIGPHNLTADKFYDGADVESAAAAWPAANALSAPLTFATTILICAVTGAGGGVPVLAHLRIVTASGAVLNAGRCALLGVGQ